MYYMLSSIYLIKPINIYLSIFISINIQFLLKLNISYSVIATAVQVTDHYLLMNKFVVLYESKNIIISGISILKNQITNII